MHCECLYFIVNLLIVAETNLQMYNGGHIFDCNCYVKVMQNANSPTLWKQQINIKSNSCNFKWQLVASWTIM